MADILWPLTARAETQEFWLEWATSRTTSTFTRQTQVMGRPGAERWRTKITLGRYDGISARAFDAFMTSMRGGIATVLVPDFRRLAPGSADYRGLQEWIEDVYATPIDIYFDTGSYWDTGEDGDPVFVAARWDADTPVPTILGGAGDTVLVGGLRPRVTAFLAGDLLQTSPGRVHEVREDAVTDNDGAVSVRVLPRLRISVAPGPLIFPARSRMRIDASAAARNPTRPPVISSYEIELTEDLNL
jgi:hypothetical protein